MRTFMLFAVLFLVGCGSQTTYSDAGVSDAVVVVDDAAVPVADDADDAAVVASDAGFVVDAAVAPAEDAAVPVDTTTPPVDAPPDAPSGSAAVELGANNNVYCLRTAGSEMWCWSGGGAPSFVAAADTLGGTCAVRDGRSFCWDGEAVFPVAGEAAIISPQIYADPAGVLHALGTTATWDPPAATRTLADGCAIGVGGELTCWNLVDTDPRPSVVNYEFADFWAVATSGVTDVARRGQLGVDAAICYVGRAGVECLHDRGVATPPSFLGATEVAMGGGRACAVTPSGVECVADHPHVFGSAGYWPLEPLPAGDVIGAHTDVAGDHLVVGADAACVLHLGEVWCWGAGNPSPHRVW